MQKVFTSPQLFESLQMKGILDAEKVPATVINEMPQKGGGWPEVWILNDEQLEKARDIVKAFKV